MNIKEPVKIIFGIVKCIVLILQIIILLTAYNKGNYTALELMSPMIAYVLLDIGEKIIIGTNILLEKLDTREEEKNGN